MQTKLLAFAAIALLAATSEAFPAPIVTMQQSLATVPSYLTLDFYFTATPDAEFLNYRINVVNANGARIQDPFVSQSDVGGDAPDTWANTVASLLGLGPASFVFNRWKPTGLGSQSPPVVQLDWSVFDVFAGDANHIAGFGDAPWHLARVLTSPGAIGNVTFTAFDTLTLDDSGAAVGTVFNFPYGVPEPSAFAGLGIGLTAVIGFVRRWGRRIVVESVSGAHHVLHA
jgi:hypothetical protein